MPKRLNKTDLRMKKFAHLHAASNFENATQAAIGAGYSKKSAHSIASRLLNNVKVQRFLVEVAEKAIKPLEIKQDDILRRLKAVAFANIADVMELWNWMASNTSRSSAWTNSPVRYPAPLSRLRFGGSGLFTRVG